MEPLKRKANGPLTYLTAAVCKRTLSALDIALLRFSKPVVMDRLLMRFWLRAEIGRGKKHHGRMDASSQGTGYCSLREAVRSTGLRRGESKI